MLVILNFRIFKYKGIKRKYNLKAIVERKLHILEMVKVISL